MLKRIFRKKGDTITLSSHAPVPKSAPHPKSFDTPHTRSEPQSFQYEPLESDEIRLLRIHPGRSIEGLVCNLVHAAVFHESWKYDALSYTWGDSLNKKSITCNGCKLAVTENVYLALRRFRSNDATVTLWIDQLCINQRDNVEKSQQVQLMKDIYGQAERVLIWLGEEADRSEAGLKLARKLLAIRELKPGFVLDILNLGWYDDTRSLPSRDHKDWQALRAIFDRPWFSHIWIIQEVVMSQGLDRRVAYAKTSTTHISNARQSLESSSSFSIKPKPLHPRTLDALADPASLSRDIQSRAIVVCGKDTLPFDELTKLTHIIPQFLPPRWFGTDGAEKGLAPHRVRAMHEHMTSRRLQKVPDLLDLLIEHRNCGATDPRDKIYALLGLGEGVYGIVPDYSATNTVEELYLNFAVSQVSRVQPGNRKEEDFEKADTRLLMSLIYSAGRTNQRLALPSWVPDWSVDFSAYPLWPVKNWSETGKSFRLGDYAAGSRALIDVECRTDNSPSGSLNELRPQSQLEKPRYSQLVLSGIPFDETLLVGHAKFDLRQRTNVQELQAAIAAWFIETGKLAAAQRERDEIYPIVGDGSSMFARDRLSTQQEAFMHTLTAGHGLGNLRDGLDENKLLQFVERPDFQSSKCFEWTRKYGRPQAFYERAVRYAHNRVFLTTSAGFMGLAPLGTQEGDVVCILFGGDVPVVLRPSGDEFVLIGECYMHGIMQGELLWDWEDDFSEGYVTAVSVPRNVVYMPIVLK